MPRTLSVEEYKELGKRYYGRRDYEKALDAFTDGIDASVGRDIQLYDYRAATYDKLENAIAALADSRQMIRAFQTDARGYLRAGQLLLKMEKKEQALQIYARGLKFIAATNMQINLLRGAHDKLNRELCPPKAMDPFTQLPIEIVEMIMSYLKFYECVSCLRVSKQWKIFLESLSALWTKMDLLRAGAKRTVKPSFVKTCINMAQGKITYARIANFSHRGILQHLVTACKSSLEKLEFVLTPLGPDSILEAVIPARQLRSLIVHADVEMPGHTMWQILKQRPTLEELRVFYLGADSLSNGREYNFDLANLRVLDLRAVHARFLATDAFEEKLPTRTPNLEELVLEQRTPITAVANIDIGRLFYPLSKLKVLRIKIACSTGFAWLPSSLKTLDIECIPPHALHTAVINYLPDLERVRLHNVRCNPLLLLHLVPPEAERDTEDPPAKAAMIKFLALSFRLPEPFWGGVDEILEHPRLQDVEDLEFEGLSALDIDDDKIGLLVQLKHLRRLHLDSARITGVGVKELVTGLKGSLRALTLTACDSVSHDAVDWAARQGIAVTINESGLKNKVVRRRIGTGFA